MVSGKPLHADEKRVIAEMRREKFPSVIARYLGKTFPQHNGGSRSTRAVVEHIKKLDRGGRR